MAGGGGGGGELVGVRHGGKGVREWRKISMRGKDLNSSILSLPPSLSLSLSRAVTVSIVMMVLPARRGKSANFILWAPAPRALLAITTMVSMWGGGGGGYRCVPYWVEAC